MQDPKTFDGSQDVVTSDSLQRSQTEYVNKMREMLVAGGNNMSLAKVALDNITVLRVYHQIARIIRYIEMCDKIEDKIYESIDFTLQSANVSNPTTWMILMTAQERLQKLMIDSQKLIQPYLDLRSFDMVNLVQGQDQQNQTALKLNADTRDRLREQAQAVLLELDAGHPEFAEQGDIEGGADEQQ